VQIGKIVRVRTINELQTLLDNYLADLKKEADDYSSLIGIKMRSSEINETAELAELKEQLEGPSDPKKKKTVKKKDKKTNWLEMDSVSVYDGVGLKGELELYFKALKELKSLIEKTQKVKETIDGLVSKGLKRDLGCVTLLGYELPFEIAFLKSNQTRPIFSYKSILSTGVE